MAELRETHVDEPLVVLAEDNDDQALVIARTLQKHGFRVRREASAQALLSSLQPGVDEIVLLDLGLPDMHGLEVLQRIVRDNADTPVIALTALDDAKIAVGAIRMGAWDYVVKRPDLSHLADLPDVIRRCGERRRMMREQVLAVRRLHDDVRERISAIQTCAGQLEAKHLPLSGQILVGEIRDSASIALGLVADFAVLRAIGAGALPLNQQPLSIGTVLERVIAEQQAPAAAKQVTLDVSVNGDVPEVTVDHALMEHAVASLLRNAIHSTPAGGTVTVSLDRDADELVLAVGDTGRGMSESALRFMLGPSWRPRATSPASEVRIFAARAIIQAHGGRLDGRGAVGEGTTFSAHLPLSAALRR